MLVQQVETLDVARRNVGIVLCLIQDGKLRVSESTKRPTAGTQKCLRAELARNDFYSDEAIQTYAWPLLIQAGGLAKGPKLALTAKGRAALSADPDEVLIGLWRRWITYGLIDELSRCEAIKGQRSMNALSALSKRRVGAAEVLVDLDEGFTDIDKLPLRFTCARSERAKFKFHLGHPEYDSLGYMGSDFTNRVDRRYLMTLLFEYAATLGLLDVAYVRPEDARDDVDPDGATDLVRLSRYDGLRMVRPTELVGRWLEAGTS